jgi:hypothetical protein
MGRKPSGGDLGALRALEEGAGPGLDAGTAQVAYLDRVPTTRPQDLPQRSCTLQPPGAQGD